MTLGLRASLEPAGRCSCCLVPKLTHILLYLLLLVMCLFIYYSYVFIPLSGMRWCLLGYSLRIIWVCSVGVMFFYNYVINYKHIFRLDYPS